MGVAGADRAGAASHAFAAKPPRVPAGVHLEGMVFLGAGVTLPAHATLIGPAWIGAGTQIRPGAFIRGNVIAGEGCVLGNSSEFKNCLLMDGVQAPHFNYVGDSVLGNRAHLGAGAICSNLRLDQRRVLVHTAGRDHRHGDEEVRGHPRRRRRGGLQRRPQPRDAPRAPLAGDAGDGLRRRAAPGDDRPGRASRSASCRRRDPEMRTLTGITPSGTLHIGNYFGAMRPAIEAQAGGDCFYFIADYHSMTTITEPRSAGASPAGSPSTGSPAAWTRRRACSGARATCPRSASSPGSRAA